MGRIRPVWPLRSLWLTALVVIVAACSSAPPTPSPPPGGQPSVIIESPANGSPTPVGQPLVVQAQATDSGPGVNRIDLRVGGILVDSEGTPGLVAQPSFSATLQYVPSADGVVTISVTAYRADGTASPPAEITVAVVIAGASLPPTASPATSATPTAAAVTPPPTPGLTPTAAPRPTLPPFATPTPTPSPTPTPAPTATPTAVDLALLVNPAGLPDPLTWMVDVEETFSVAVTNVGDVSAPAASIRVRLCATEGPCGQNGAGQASSSPLDAGTALDYEVSITPLSEGERVLRIRLVLPDGFVDTDPSNNEYLSDPFEVQPAPPP